MRRREHDRMKVLMAILGCDQLDAFDPLSSCVRILLFEAHYIASTA